MYFFLFFSKRFKKFDWVEGIVSRGIYFFFCDFFVVFVVSVGFIWWVFCWVMCYFIVLFFLNFLNLKLINFSWWWNLMLCDKMDWSEIINSLLKYYLLCSVFFIFFWLWDFIIFYGLLVRLLKLCFFFE